MVLVIDPETLQAYEMNGFEGEWTMLDGCKYYAMSKRVFAVIFFRINRAAEAVKAGKLDGETWRMVVRRFYAIASEALKQYGSDWIEAAEAEAIKQLEARKNHAN